ncbi:MAG: hypothetical protein WCJ56_14665 [bacterium]
MIFADIRNFFHLFDILIDWSIAFVAALFAYLAVAAVAAPLTGTFAFTLQNVLRLGNDPKPLADMTVAGDALTGTLSMRIKGDAWVPGGGTRLPLYADW